MNEEAKFHWSEGMKYALEAMKALFILNGVSAISVLTFVGNTKSKSPYLIISMVVFGCGALCGAISMLMAYLAQLHYGKMQSKAQLIHNWAYVPPALGIALFLVGLCMAASGLWNG
jgi:hypothetical protein